MQVRTYVGALAFGTVCALGSWVAVVMMVDPRGGLPSLFLFFATLFFSLFGIFTTFLTVMRRSQVEARGLETVLSQGMRQACLLTIAIVVSLLLSRSGYLTLPVLVVLAISLGLMEWRLSGGQARG